MQDSMAIAKDVRTLIEETVISLPTIPSVFLTVLDKVARDKSSAEDVARIIERDQSLTSKVLTVVNSSAYGFQNKISTVPRAVALLGFDLIRNLALSVSVFDDFLKRQEIACFDKTKFWEHCLVCAAVAREIAQQLYLPNPDEIYVAGLLHDIGKVALDKVSRENYSEIIAHSSMSRNWLAVEQTRLGVNHAEVGGILARKWSLPDNIGAAITHHHEMPKSGLTEEQAHMTAAVSVADFICWTHGFGSVYVLHPPHLCERVSDLVEIDNLDIGKIYDAMDRQIMSTAKLFHLSIPDTRTFREALMRANSELGHLNSLYQEARTQLDRQVRQLSCLNRAIYQIRQDLDAKATVKALLRAIRDEFGFARTLFFKLNKSGERLELTDSLTEPLKEPYDAAGFQESRLLARSLKKKQIAKFENAGEWKGDPLFVSLITNEIFVIPIPSKRGLVGVVTADNGDSREAADSTSMDSLNILAQEAGLAIENALLFEKTRELAIKDDLTQLYNRRHILQALETEMQRSQRYDRPLSIAMLDIDHFKKINDAFGHRTGDDVLRSIARYLKGSSRVTDMVGRYGGEEFLVILPETNAEGAIGYSERVRRAVEEFGKTQLSEFAPNLTISGGVSAFDPSGDTLETLLDRVDRALYKAKETRNRIAVL